MKEKTKIALVSFGRSHWLKMPRLGLVILTNKINSLPEYYCEYFDYEVLDNRPKNINLE